MTDGTLGEDGFEDGFSDGRARDAPAVGEAQHDEVWTPRHAAHGDDSADGGVTDESDQTAPLNHGYASHGVHQAAGEDDDCEGDEESQEYEGLEEAEPSGDGGLSEDDEPSEDDELSEDDEADPVAAAPDYVYEDDDEDDDEDEDDEAGVAKTSSSLKWGLAAVVLLAVVAVVLVAVVLMGGDTGKGGQADSASSSHNAAASGIASADDTGPVSVIIDDPSCTAWTSISSNLANTLSLLSHGKWGERDQTIPATAWNDEQKKEYMAAGQVVRTAAAQTIGLVKLTPHRVMRELYEQFIAYSRAFVEHIPTYTARDASLSGTAHSAASALAAICAATNNGSAAARGPLVEAQSAPTKVAPPGSPTNPQRYLTGPNPVCTEWQAALDKFGADIAEWTQMDPSVPGTFWNPQQKAVNLAAGPVMISLANKMQQLGRRSNNPVLQDFAELAAQYRRAFVVALATYDPSDNYLANASTFVSTTVLGACGAV